MKPEYYIEYYQLERKNWWFLARKNILKEQISKLFKGKPNLKILNVGAALGATTVLLNQFGEVTSLEYDKSCCEFAKKELGMDFINGSITELPFPDNEFDLVCAFDVVEHVEDDVKAVSELHRVCKPNGYTFTTVPTFRFLWSDHDVINEHKRRYTISNYLQLFDPKTSSIKFKSYFNFWLFFPIATVRVLLSSFKKTKSNKPVESDFGKVREGFISKILYYIFNSESFFLKKGIQLPVGVSLMVISIKK